MADVKTGMEKADMKRLLNLAKKEPVNCAAGAGSDTNSALLLMDKIKQPRALEKDLLKSFPDAKNMVFGTAVVDADEDAKLVKFTINKKAGTIAKRLVKTLKGTGFSKVMIVLEDGTAVETYGEEDAEESEASPPPPPPPPGHDAAQLQRLLAALIPRIPQAAGDNAAVKGLLAKLAGEANANLKAADLEAATASIQHLKKALDEAAAGTAPKPTATPDPSLQAATGAVAFAKSRLAWLAARKKMESEIDKLRLEIVATYQAEGIGPDLEKRYAEKTAPIMEALDEELADKLDDANNATDPAIRAKLVEEAKAAMSRYETFLVSDKIIAELDSNPFVPLSIRTTISGTLSALSKTVR